MKNTHYYLFIVVSLLFSSGCQDELTPESEPLPEVTTAKIIELSLNSINAGGNVVSEGDAPVTSKGICWSYRGTPTINDSVISSGADTGSFTVTLEGLFSDMDYSLRAYATNSFGTAYGEEVEFKTGAVYDADGNIYHSVTIGTQVWLVENLRTTKFNDSSDIPEVTDNALWNSIDNPQFCWYQNDRSYKEPYGALYNWACINSGKLCPPGWHVPSNDEWISLISKVGNLNSASDFLRESGSQHWTSPNTGATNSSGFTALPGSFRNTDGSFGPNSYYGYWWSVTSSGEAYAFAFSLIASRSAVDLENVLKGSGLSVRCLKNSE